MTWSVVVNADRCEGHALCAGHAPEVFELDDDEQSRVLVATPPDALRPRVEQAVTACPRQAITIVELGSGVDETARPG